MRGRPLATFFIVFLFVALTVGCSPGGSASPDSSGADEGKLPAEEHEQTQMNPPQSPGQPGHPPAGTGGEEGTDDDPLAKRISSMTLDEKIGQMFLVGMDGVTTNAQTEKMIKTFRIGGFILFAKNMTDGEQANRLLNSLKATNLAANSAPLFLAVDEEGGRVSRLPSEFVKIPSSGEIGEVNHAGFAREIGKLQAKRITSLGFNLNFAPVLDVQSNPDNPVIGDRSFGDNAEKVGELGVAEMRGLREEGVIPVMKHFPGHGDTSVDSHVGLPVVEHDLNRLMRLELVPFMRAIEHGADAVMAAHILLPKLDGKHPASLSPAVLTGLLRNELHFGGVIITDDMTMGAITSSYEMTEAVVQAVQAGSDIVLIAHDFKRQTAAIGALKRAVERGIVTEERIDESVYRILRLKEKYNLSDSPKKYSGPDETNEAVRRLLGEYMG